MRIGTSTSRIVVRTTVLAPTHALHELAGRRPRIGITGARVGDDGAHARGELAAGVGREHLEQAADRVDIDRRVMRRTLA